jgi:predicted DNA-binding WGR domain protein
MSKIRTQTGSYATAKYQLKRSLLENAVEDTYTSQDREEALEFFGGCAFCGSTPAPRNDHLIPVFECGDRVRRNIVPACQPCDDSKGKKGYREWMQTSRSSRSLKKFRGLSDAQIEARIKLIEKWRSGYKPKTEQELFGKDYGKYLEILHRMDELCAEAEQLTNRVKERRGASRTVESVSIPQKEDQPSSADEIRQFVLRNYILPERKRGARTVTVNAGIVHNQMSFVNRLANVCQVLGGEKFQKLANVGKPVRKGPPQGSTATFTYRL